MTSSFIFPSPTIANSQSSVISPEPLPLSPPHSPGQTLSSSSAELPSPKSTSAQSNCCRATFFLSARFHIFCCYSTENELSPTRLASSCQTQPADLAVHSFHKGVFPPAALSTPNLSVLSGTFPKTLIFPPRTYTAYSPQSNSSTHSVSSG